MALRSPVEFHNFWGTINPATSTTWSSGTLPNEGAVPTYQSTRLQAGDFAYVTVSPSSGSFYLCTDPGLPLQTNAIWVEVSNGPDKFAPKYLVGNTLNGDSTASYSSGGFVYFPDPGDGSGIAAALSAASLVTGDVWIRPGTYDLSSGSVAVPMPIPANVRVEGSGAGATTILSKKNPDSQQVFECAAGSSIFDLSIASNGTSTYSGVNSYALVKANGSGVSVQNVKLTVSTQDVTDGLRSAVLIDCAGSGAIPFISLENVFVQGESATTPQTTPSSLIKVIDGVVSARAVTTYGGDIGFEVYNTSQGPSSSAVLFAQDVLCVQFARTGAWYHQTALAVGTGAMRISTGLFVGVAGADIPAAHGVRLQGGSLHVLRSNYIVNVDTGVLVDPPVDVVATGQLTSSLIASNVAGVEIGTGLGTVNGFGVTDCEINSTQFGVRVEQVGASTVGITVSDNSINTSYANGSLPIYIADATNTVPSGNVINQSDGGGSGFAIWVNNSKHCTCVDNLVVSDGVNGIWISSGSDYATLSGNDVTLNSANTASGCYRMDSVRNVVQGNIAHVDTGGFSSCVGIDMTQNSSFCTVVANTVEVEAGIGIALAGSKTTCNGNTMGVDTTPTAAIFLAATSSNNVVIGNFCGTTPPVDNTSGGTGNEVAHNI